MKAADCSWRTSSGRIPSLMQEELGKQHRPAHEEEQNVGAFVLQRFCQDLPKSARTAKKPILFNAILAKRKLFLIIHELSVPD